MTFSSIYKQGFLRVAACTPKVSIANPAANAQSILSLATQAHDQSVAVALFPELCLTGYAIDDLFQQDVVLEATDRALRTIVEASKRFITTLVVGAPVAKDGRLYNCAVVIEAGEIKGVVPKTFLPNYREFYERRHFASGVNVRLSTIAIAGVSDVPFGTDLIFAFDNLPDAKFFVEICEDVWTPVPPSSKAALAGANILLNLSASNITIGKGDARRMLCQSQSSRCIAAYVYSAAGAGESTNDLAWDGQALICENGEILQESDRFVLDEQMIVADIDLDRLRQERMRTVTFNDCREANPEVYRTVPLDLGSEQILHYLPGVETLMRKVERFPFVPANPVKLNEDCYEAYNIQVHGLVQRLRWTRSKKIVIGVSGGLDSTQALIVAARAFDLLGWSRKDILGFTLPGFATGSKTKGNAWALMNALGITAEEIDITPAARQMLADMKHPFADGQPVYDVTFENVQAGLRTDYLFRMANQRGGIVLGTGDMSELALGWCTYGVGDHMSYYNVNSGVPKTLIQYLIRWVYRENLFAANVNSTLWSILDTEISPELIPAGADGVMQSTESKIGPYELQDFNLYYVQRRGYRPSKVAFLAYHAWKQIDAGVWPANFSDENKHAYDLAEIKKWLTLFLERFFGFSQFKRTAVPNGPKVSAGGSLSPRGDWRAPSDGNAEAWLAEVKAVPDRLNDGPVAVRRTASRMPT